MTATPRVVNFTSTPEMLQRPSGRVVQGLKQPINADGKLLTPKQIRARARRRRARGQHLDEQEMEYLYPKPVEEWDLEELARGRPKNARGKFSGPSPQWVDRSVFEAATSRFTNVVKGEMRATTVDALKMLTQLINNEDVDERGKPFVAASTKLDAAKFLLEHVVGKPTQRIENDVSVRLQGILATVMVNPGEQENTFTPAHFPGITMQLANEVDDDEDMPEE